MQLNIFTKSQDEALQIVEQIIPFFNPQYTITIKPFSAHPDILEDCPITLSGMSYSDDYEGSLWMHVEQLYINWTLRWKLTSIQVC